MGKRQRMITDEVLCSTKFLNLHSDTQLLYIYLILHCDDDGIVDPFPIMRLTGITNLSALEELISKEFIYQLDHDGIIYYMVHFHVQNRIPPSKKIDSIHLPLLVEKHPELIGTIVIANNKNYAHQFSQDLTKLRKMEADSNFLPKERNKEYTGKIFSMESSSLINDDSNKEYISMPEELRKKCNSWHNKKE